MPNRPAKRVAILQSSYIPWKGYFDIINSVDEFILYDDVQYTARDWRNRNRVKTAQGLVWLTVPVRHEGRSQRLAEARAVDSSWRRRHWRTWQTSYGRAAYFREYREWLEALYLGSDETRLSEINAAFIRAICTVLGMRTRVSWSSDYRLVEGRTERLVDLCRQAGATVYLSGPAAQAYIRPEAFAEAGIGLRWMSYDGYREYPQLHGPFEHRVSILDLLLNTGAEAPAYMLSFGRPASVGCAPPGSPHHA